MARSVQVVWEPRKSPVQARSAASVDAILSATVQVLLDVGKDRLTTTRVASRAGVSVGTLYQYFPNKVSLLRAALERHMEEILAAVVQVCREQRGRPLEQMAEALATAFLAAKMRDVKTSVALYAVSSDVDGMKVSAAIGEKTLRLVVAMLKTAPERLTADPQLVGTMVQSVMGGVSRRLVESPAPERQLERMRRELVRVLQVYLRAVSES